MSIHAFPPAEYDRYVEVLRHVDTPTAKRALQTALRSYDRVCAIYSTAYADRGRAAQGLKDAKRRAPLDLLAEVASVKGDTVPVHIVDRVAAAEVAEHRAGVALDVAADTVAPAVAQVRDALRSWGAAGAWWCATRRAESGPDRMPDDDGLTLWVAERVGVSFILPPEVLDDARAAEVAPSMNHNGVDRMRRIVLGLPHPVGPTGREHPDNFRRNRVTGERNQFTADDYRAYDALRFRRWVSYWACCAAATDGVEVDTTGRAVFRVTADWNAAAALVARFVDVPVATG